MTCSSLDLTETPWGFDNLLLATSPCSVRALEARGLQNWVWLCGCSDKGRSCLHPSFSERMELAPEQVLLFSRLGHVDFLLQGWQVGLAWPVALRSCPRLYLCIPHSLPLFFIVAHAFPMWGMTFFFCFTHFPLCSFSNFSIKLFFFFPWGFPSLKLSFPLVNSGFWGARLNFESQFCCIWLVKINLFFWSGEVVMCDFVWLVKYHGNYKNDINMAKVNNVCEVLSRVLVW